MSVSLFLLKAFSHALRLGLTKHKHGAVVQTDRIAEIRLFLAPALFGVHHKGWKSQCEKDVRKQTRRFRNLAPLCNNELLQRVHLISLLNIIGD